VSSSEGGALGRAALRIEWASRALIGAGEDLQAAGAAAAADVVSEEAERVEGLAGEVRQLGTVTELAAIVRPAG
jgi:hypothetical protein